MGLLARLGGWSSDLTKAATFPSPIYAEDVAASDPVIAAAFGLSTEGCRVTRAQAMSIPAVKRGRNVICGTIGAQPLVAVRGAELERVERQLLSQPNANTTRQHVLTWTVDDLLFYGIAWWLITDKDATKYPTRVERLAHGRVVVDLSTGKVRVDGQVVSDDRLIRFDGPDEGLLAYSESLSTALLLERAVRRNADGLPPMDMLTPEVGAPELTREEIDAVLSEWQEARRSKGTAFVNSALKHTGVGYDAAAAGLAEARAFQIGEVARLLNLPPRYVAADTGSSMTYSNITSERLELVDLSLAPYLTALGQRLSMGDVTPLGQTVLVDMSEFLRGDLATAVETAAASIAAGLRTSDEERGAIYKLPPLPAPAAPAAPTPEATP